MKHLGDITKINGAEIDPVDIITFGSPCQDLSVAGNRKGLSGERSGLFMEAVRIIKEMRNATKQLRLSGANDDIRLSPRIAIWENVPGAFSSNNGEDFRCVLEELARIENPEVSIPKPKKWMPSGCIELPCGCITWRTHDAQYWGVPQRRKRISLIVDFRNEPEPEIQLVSRSVSGNTAESDHKGEEVTGIVGEGIDTAISFQERCGKPGGVKESLSKMTTLEHCPQQTIKPLCIGNGQLHDALTPSEKCKTLNTMVDPMKVVCVGNGQLAQAELSEKVGALNCMHDQQAVIVLEGNGSRPSHNGDGFNESDVSYTLNAVEHHAVCVGVDAYNQTTTGDKSKSLNSAATDSDHVPCVCYGLDRASFNQGKNAKFDISIQEDIAQPIVARGPGGGNADKVNALCARDFKGVGNQYVAEGKCIIQPYNGNDSKN